MNANLLFKIIALLLFTTSQYAFGQDDIVPTLGINLYQEQVEAVTMSEDKSIIVLASSASIKAISALDNSILFQSVFPRRFNAINHVEIDAKNQLVAILADYFFVLIYDIEAQSLIQGTDLRIPIPVAKTARTGGVEKIRESILDAESECRLQEHTKRLLFREDKLLVVYPTYVVKFLLENDEPDFEHEFRGTDYRRVFIQREQDANNRYPYYVQNSPWADSIHTIINRKYHYVSYSPDSEKAYVKFSERDIFYYEIWDIKSREKFHQLKKIDDIFDSSISNPILSPNGDEIIFSFSEAKTRKELSVNRIFLKFNFRENSFSRLSNDTLSYELLGNIKSTHTGRFIYGAAGHINDIKEALSVFDSGQIPETADNIANSVFFLFDSKTEKIATYPIGGFQIKSMFNTQDNQFIFVATEDGLWQYSVATDVCTKIVSFGSPKIIALKVTNENQLLIGTNQGIRVFDLFTFQQLNYAPIPDISRIAFDDSCESAYYANKRFLGKFNIKEDYHTLDSSHLFYVKSLAVLSDESGLISSSFDDFSSPFRDGKILIGDVGFDKNSFEVYSYFEEVGDFDEEGNREKVKRQAPQKLENPKVSDFTLSSSTNTLAGRLLGSYGFDIGHTIKALLEAAMDSTSLEGMTNQLEAQIKKSDSYPGEIKIWHKSQGQWVEGNMKIPTGDYFDTQSRPLAISNDDEYLASVNERLGIEIYDIKKGDRACIFQGKHSPDYNLSQFFSLLDGEGNKIIESQYNISALTFSPNNEFLISAGNLGDIEVWIKSNQVDSSYSDVGTCTFRHFKSLSDPVQSGKVNVIAFSKDNKIMFTGGNEGIISVWDFELGTVVACIVLKNNSDAYLSFTGKYYYCHPNARDLVYLRHGNRILNFEEFDLYYNRPDFVSFQAGLILVNDSTSMKKALSEIVHQGIIVEKRFQQFGIDTNSDFNPIQSKPELILLNNKEIIDNQVTAEDYINIKCSMRSQSHFSHLNLSVNSVPTRPIDFKKLLENDTYYLDFNVELSNGENIIHFSVEDINGVRSPRKALRIRREKKEKVNLYLLVCGVEQYDSIPDLKYSLKDGRDVISLFSSRENPLYESVIIDSLFGKDFFEINLKKWGKKLEKSRPSDVVIFYYAGHGFQTAENDFVLTKTNTSLNALLETGINYEDIEDIISIIPARQKLILLDACNSGLRESMGSIDVGLAKELETPTEGSRGRPDGVPVISANTSEFIFLKMREMFVDVQSEKGIVAFAASSGYDSANEMEQYENGIFTFAILEALKFNSKERRQNADLDGNGMVDIEEMVEFVKRLVPKATKERGDQTPTIRSLNLRNNFFIW